MVQVNISLVKDDEALFKTLKKTYRQEIGEFQWWFAMRTIIKIRFVQVGHLQLQLIAILAPSIFDPF